MDKVDIRDIQGNIRFSTPINDGSKRKFMLMKEDYITLNFSLAVPVYFQIGDGIDNDLGIFELVDLYKPTYNTTTGAYDYELRLDAYYWKWKNKKFFYTPESTGREAGWNLTATLDKHLDVFLDNLKTLGYKFRDLDFTWDIDSTVENTSKLVSYDNVNLIDSLTQMAETWECEWWITEHVIHFGRCEYSSPVDFKAGDLTDTENVNVNSMTRSDSQTTYATRIYAFGSTRNIPSSYRKDLIFDVKEVNGRNISDTSRPLKNSYFPLSSKIENKVKLTFPENAAYVFENVPVNETNLADVVKKTNIGTLEKGNYEFNITHIKYSTIMSSGVRFNGIFRLWVSLNYTVNSASETITLLNEQVNATAPVGTEEILEIKDKLVSFNLPSQASNCSIDVGVSVWYITSTSSAIINFLLKEEDIKYGNNGNSVSVTFLTGANAGQTFQAIYNPTFLSGDNSNVIQLPEGVTASSGNRYTINNIIGGKVPDNYFNKDDKEMTLNGVVQKRLMLPEGISYVDAYRYSPTGERINIGDERYDDPDNVEMPEEEAIEEIVIFEDEYPQYNGTISSVSHDDKVDDSDKEYRIYSFKDTGLKNFTEDFRLDGEELHMIFQTGKLAGMDFAINIVESDSTGTTFEIVRNEDYGRFLPDDVLYPQATHIEDGEEVPADTYILYGFDTAYISEQMLPDAEQNLLKKAKEYVKKSMIDPSTYDCEMDADFIYNKGNIRTYEVGAKVNLINKAFFQEGRQSRIIGFEWPLDFPYDHPIYTVGETASYSRIGEIESKLDSLTYKGQTYSGSTVGGGGTSVYIIGVNDKTLPSDRNVFSSKKSLATFLNKTQEETMEFLIKLLGGVIADNIESQGFISGALGSGFLVKRDPKTGRSYIEVDEIYVRLKAVFDSLEIRHTTHVGGQQILSPAGMTCIRVEEYDTYYRCFMKADDGSKAVLNLFAEGDQAQCRDMNIKEGIYENISNQYYWRLVVGVGDDYIDLSKDDCDTGSTIPAVGDSICQLGNRTNRNRQNAIVLSTVGVDAPSFKQYAGIDSYSLEGKEVTTLSPDGNKLTGVMHIEGGSTGAGNLSDLPDEIQEAVQVGSVNLIVNSGFTGNYESENLEPDSMLSPDSEMYNNPLNSWTGVVTVLKDDASSSGYSAEIGAISQNIKGMIPDEKYVLSFRARGTDITVAMGAFSLSQPLTGGLEKYIVKFTFSGESTLLLSGTAVICDLKLERGTVPTDWTLSPYDNEKFYAKFQSLSYLTSAIKDGSVDVLGGLILASMLQLGNHKDGKMQKVTSGISGIYNDDNDVAQWGGGTFEQAIRAVMMFKDNPSYQPGEDELKSIAKFVVTHGGRSILNDVIVRGYIYALGGVFSGKVSIADEKILLNEDGTGHLADGKLSWDLDGLSVTGAIQTPYREWVIDQSSKYTLDIDKHRYVFVYYRKPIYNKDYISRINLPDVVEGRNGSEIRIFTSHERFTQDTEPVYIQYGLPIWFPGYNYYKDPPLRTLLLKGKEAVFRCMSFGGAVGWWLQNYNDFTDEELNPVEFEPWN